MSANSGQRLCYLAAGYIRTRFEYAECRVAYVARMVRAAFRHRQFNAPSNRATAWGHFSIAEPLSAKAFSHISADRSSSPAVPRRPSIISYPR